MAELATVRSWSGLLFSKISLFVPALTLESRRSIINDLFWHQMTNCVFQKVNTRRKRTEKTCFDACSKSSVIISNYHHYDGFEALQWKKVILTIAPVEGRGKIHFSNKKWRILTSNDKLRVPKSEFSKEMDGKDAIFWRLKASKKTPFLLVILHWVADLKVWSAKTSFWP